jgi:hypothetical protein
VAAWKLPLIVAAIAVPVVLGFAVAGAGVGVAIGALAAVAIVVVAVRQRPRGAIGEAHSEDRPRRLLLVVTRPVEDRKTVEGIAARAAGNGESAEVVVLAPARIGFLDRWASDVEPARRQAQRNLVLTVAALAKAGVSAEARVGDEDLVQAVEDQIGEFAASEVILVTGEAERERPPAGAEEELASRLRPRFERLRVSGPATD